MNRLIESIPIKRLKANAKLPSRGTPHSAGLDLYAIEDKIIQPKTRGLIGTGIATAIPYGYYGRIAPRSGLSINNGIHLGAGVIDSDYRGQLGVVIFNLSQQAFMIREGMRIAQLIIQKIEVPDVIEVQELESTNRGESGYGSTGFHQQLKGFLLALQEFVKFLVRVFYLTGDFLIGGKSFKEDERYMIGCIDTNRDQHQEEIDNRFQRELLKRNQMKEEGERSDF